MKVDLVIIDPQNSFCKLVPAADQQKLHNGELCVPGAWDDMERVATMVRRLKHKWRDIKVTMDSHRPMHISHPTWYKDAKGSPPDPFTLMREENNRIIGYKFDNNGNTHDVGEYTTVSPTMSTKTLNYIKALAVGKRYPHCIWPPHCLIGTPGHNIVEPLMEAMIEWEVSQQATLSIVTKGSNPWVEHFSAVKAEVVDPEDITTQMNTKFVESLLSAEQIVLCGEALSHCLCNTVRDVADSFGDDSYLKKCVLLTDCASSVPGFESYGSTFVSDMKKRGMQTTTSKDYLA